VADAVGAQAQEVVLVLRRVRLAELDLEALLEPALHAPGELARRGRWVVVEARIVVRTARR